MFKSLLQFTLCTAMIFASVSCKEKLSVEDEVDNIRELKALKMSLQTRRPGYQRSHDSKRDKKVIKLEMQVCQPYPSIVKVEKQGEWGSFFYPSFVELHRCAGGCYVSPRIQKCTVDKQDEVIILVKNMDRKQLEVKIPMSNHTDCKCKCLMEKCNAKQKFNTSFCRCECTEDGRQCEQQENKHWNKHSCECKCKASLFCSIGEKWSKDSCKCEPESSVIKLL